MGGALQLLGRFDEAIHNYQQALRLNPNFAEAHNNLGAAFDHQERLDEAVRCFEQAVRLKPAFAEALCNWGNTLQRQDKLDEAVPCFQRALAVKPGYGEALVGLATVLFYQGRPDAAVDTLRKALAVDPGLAKAQTNLLFCLNYDPQADPQAVFAEHCRWGSLQTLPTPLPHANAPAPNRRLRIGYVSPDFRQSALFRYIEPVLVNHDPRQVQVFCYAEITFADAFTQRLQKLAHAWRWTHGLTDSAVAQRIREDGIDILVDLAGLTDNSRLRVFAHKPAPIQATWLGYLNTTGLTAIDYRLTDDVLHPPGQPAWDVEELVRLPGGMCCFAPPPDALPVTPLPALRRGHLTFGSLSILFKVNSAVIDLWAKVLQALPTARLLMFHDKLTAAAQERIRGQFSQCGIAGERLDLRQGSVTPGYLRIYNEIDIALDTFPFSGGVTTCEALWMGVPVLTLTGATVASRNSAALLARVGLTDMAVQTPEQYVAKAVSLANELERLTKVRQELRQRMATTLCNGRRFTRGLEDAYRMMWRRWCR